MVLNPQYTEPVIRVDESQAYRCPYCNQILFKGSLGPGTVISVKCNRHICRRVLRLAVF
jgi:hypothetical protein